MKSVVAIRSILIKDFRLLWPAVLLCWALFVIAALIPASNWGIRSSVNLIIYLATGLLMIAAVQTDAPAGLSKDWQTRPIAPATLVAAKLLFLVAALMVPSFAGRVVQALRTDVTLPDALFAASTSITMIVMMSMFLIAAGVVTRNLLETGGLLVGVAAAFAALAILPNSPLESFANASVAGSNWISTHGIGLVALLGSILALCFQYLARRTAIARAAFGAMVVGMILTPLAFHWKTVFAIQKALAPGSSDVVAVGLSASAECGEKSLETKLDVIGLPAGWMPMIDLVRLESGEAERMPANPRAPIGRSGEGSWSVTHFWPGASVAPASRLRVLLTLFEPLKSASVSLDGREHKLPGVGACRALPDFTGKLVYLNCVIPGAQPAYVTASLDLPDADIVPSEAANYAPQILRDAFNNVHSFTLPLPPERADSAMVTLYEAAAHLDRIAPVALPAAQCPGTPGAE